MSAIPLSVLSCQTNIILGTVTCSCVWWPPYCTFATYTPDHPQGLVKTLNKPLHSCWTPTELLLGDESASKNSHSDIAFRLSNFSQRRPFWKMAATSKATLGSRADKCIIIGRPQEYSAYYVCIPPLGAVNPCLYHKRHSGT